MDLTNAKEYIRITPDGEGGTLTGSIPADKLGDFLLVDFDEALYSLLNIASNQLDGYRFSDIELMVDMILDWQAPARAPYIHRFHIGFTAFLKGVNGDEIPVRIEEEVSYLPPDYALYVDAPKGLDAYVEWTGE